MSWIIYSVVAYTVVGLVAVSFFTCSSKTKNQNNQTKQKINIDCPYLFPDQMWQTSIKLLETFLPKIDRHTRYIYLIARRNKDTLQQSNTIC